MKWPLVTRKRHEREVDMMTTAIRDEYQRARREGRAQVHAWARDLNFELFHMDSRTAVGRMRAALQQAESMFAPPQVDTQAILAEANK